MQQDTNTLETKTSTQNANITQDVNALMTLMHEFSILINKENEYLRTAQFRAIETLQEDKRRLVAEYKDRIQDLYARKVEFAALDTDLAEQLVIKRTDFVKLLGENLRALSAAKNSTHRLVDRIINVARDAAEHKTNYNAMGGMMTANPSGPTSVRLNQEL